MVHGRVSVAEFGDGDGAYPDRVDVLVGSGGSGLDVDRDGPGPFDAVEDLGDRQVGDVGLRLVVPVGVFDRDPGCHVSILSRRIATKSRAFIGFGVVMLCAAGLRCGPMLACAVRLPTSGDCYSSGVGGARFLPRFPWYTRFVWSAGRMVRATVCAVASYRFVERLDHVQ